MLVGLDMNLNSCQFNPGLLHCIIKHSKRVFGQENRLLYNAPYLSVYYLKAFYSLVN